MIKDKFKSSKWQRQVCMMTLTMLALSSFAAKVKKTINPWVDNTNTANLFIDAVELTPDSTTLTFHTYSYLHSNINIQSGSKLICNGKSYPLRHANGIELGQAINIPELGDTTFTISFEPLPMKTITFDFIEGDGDNSFRLEGVHTDRSFDSQSPLEELNLLPAQKWEKGTATLKGKILNYKPSDQPDLIEVYPRSALGRNMDENLGKATVNPDGSFEVKLPVYQSHQPCFFKAPGFYGLMYLSSGQETSVTIDPSQRANQGHTGKNGSVVYTGANEEINNQLALNIGHDMVWNAFFNNMSREKKYTSASEYRWDIERHSANSKEKIRRLPFTPMMKQLMNVIIDNDAFMSLDSRMETRDFGDIEPSYFDFYKKIDITDPLMMWAENYDSSINNGYNPFKDNLRLSLTSIPCEFYSFLLENNIVSSEDADLARSIMANHIDSLPKDVVDGFAHIAAERVSHYCDSLSLQGPERLQAQKLTNRLERGELNSFNDVQSHYISWIFGLLQNGQKISFQEAWNIPYENDMVAAINRYKEENDSIISAFNSRYEDQYEVWQFEKEIDTAIENFTKRYGKEAQIINQLYAAHAYNTHIERRNILPEAYIENCKQRLPDIFFDHVMTQNEEMKKVLSRAKSNILEMNPANSGKQVLKEIAEKFKGKVIYIDIWGTWCSPCLHAITEIQPVKKDYADNVAFVYLADESSPEKAWEEKIKSIEGEHMRLPQSKMQEIMARFSFSGYPSYIVIGKDGEVSYSGFIHGLDNVKRILDEAIAK